MQLFEITIFTLLVPFQKVFFNVVSVGTLNVVVPVGSIAFIPEMSVNPAISLSVILEYGLTRFDAPMFFTLGNTALSSARVL